MAENGLAGSEQRLDELQAAQEAEAAEILAAQREVERRRLELEQARDWLESKQAEYDAQKPREAEPGPQKDDWEQER